MPLYFKVWDGNVTDDRTHVKNWLALRGLLGRADFTYVADSKLCTREAMELIDSEGGFFVTVMPQTRTDDGRFKDWIQENSPQWQEVIRRPDPKRKYAPQHVYWTFESPFHSSEGFRIIWVRSSQKQILDAASRSRAIERTEQDFSDLSLKRFSSRKTHDFFQFQIEARIEERYRQEHKGRPTKNTRYCKTEKKRYGKSIRFQFTLKHVPAGVRQLTKYSTCFVTSGSTEWSCRARCSICLTSFRRSRSRYLLCLNCL